MVTFTSALGRYAVLLSVVGFGKDNYVIAAAGSSTLMEEEPSASTAAWTGVHRQLATCCLLTGTSECHPNDACNAKQKDCENAGGRNKCNLNGNYSWGDSSPVPPPTPNPVSLTNALLLCCYLLCHIGIFHSNIVFFVSYSAHCLTPDVSTLIDASSCQSNTSSNQPASESNTSSYQSSSVSLLRSLCGRYFNLL